MNSDLSLLLWFNGHHSPALDQVAMILTSGFTWIPLYLLLLFLIVRRYSRRTVWKILGCVALCLLLSDGLPDGIVKPLVGRLRPSHDPALSSMLHIVDNHRNTLYGFFSAHASNTMGIALFFSLLLRNPILVATLMCWVLVNCWTRMYLGLHYPSDILVGLLWGAVSATVAYTCLRRVQSS